MKGYEPKYGLYAYEDGLGYMRLAIGKKLKDSQCVHVAFRQYDLVGILNQLIRDFDLLPALCSFGSGDQAAHTPDGSNTARPTLPAPEIYNMRVAEALFQLSEGLPTYAIIDKGRTTDEKSCIWVEKGKFYAMGYIDVYSDLQSLEDIRDSLTRYPANHYITQLISAFAGKYPWKVISVQKKTPADGRGL